MTAPLSDSQAVDHAITSRMSTRAFTNQAVPKALITEILQVASRAPSGTNTQPWKVYVLQGKSRDTLVEKVCAAHDAMRANPEVAKQYQEQYDYYPTQWVSPYIDRRRENGWSLYGLLGIGKGDKDKMHLQHQRNFKFFDAPVGMMFTLDPIMGRGSMFDYGMFVQNIMLAARARGLHTCAEASIASYPDIVRRELGISRDYTIMCGIAMGYAQDDAVVNTFQPTRIELDEYATFYD